MQALKWISKQPHGFLRPEMNLKMRNSKCSAVAVLFGWVVSAISAAAAPAPPPQAGPDIDTRMLRAELENLEAGRDGPPQAAVFPPPNLKAQKGQNIKDAARLAQLAAEVKNKLEKDSQFMVSVECLKKVEEMQKLARQLHDRINGSGAPN
jgi:hypothetical protein